MAIFGALTEYSTGVYEFVKETRERLKVHDIKKNPYDNAKIVIKKLNEKLLIVFNLEPVYFDTSIIGLYIMALFFAIGLIFNRYVYFVLYFGIAFWVLSSFVKSNAFHFWLLRKALKKRGVKNIKYLNPQEILKRLLK